MTSRAAPPGVRPRARWTLHALRHILWCNRFPSMQDLDRGGFASTTAAMVAPVEAAGLEADAKRLRALADVLLHLPFDLHDDERRALVEYVVEPERDVEATGERLIPAEHWKAMEGIQARLRESAETFERVAKARKRRATKAKQGGGSRSGRGDRLAVMRQDALLRDLHATLCVVLAERPWEAEPVGSAFSEAFGFANDATLVDGIGRTLNENRSLRSPRALALAILRDLLRTQNLDGTGFGVPNLASAAGLDARTWARILRPKRSRAPK